MDEHIIDYYSVIDKPNYVKILDCTKLNKKTYDKNKEYFVNHIKSIVPESVGSELYTKLKIVGINIGLYMLNIATPLYPYMKWKEFKNLIIKEITNQLEIDYEINDIEFSNEPIYKDVLENINTPYEILEDGSELYITLIKVEDEWQTFYVLNDDHDKIESDIKVCVECMEEERTEKFIKCSVCNFTYYCSKYCEYANWSKHKNTCSINL